jgi:hypothetical protein
LAASPQPFGAQIPPSAETNHLLNQENKTMKTMRLNAPTQTLWLISLILGVLGILSHLIRMPPLSAYSFWMLAIGFIVLVIATMNKNA